MLSMRTHQIQEDRIMLNKNWGSTPLHNFNTFGNKHNPEFDNNMMGIHPSMIGMLGGNKHNSPPPGLGALGMLGGNQAMPMGGMYNLGPGADVPNMMPSLAYQLNNLGLNTQNNLPYGGDMSVDNLKLIQVLQSQLMGGQPQPSESK